MGRHSTRGGRHRAPGPTAGRLWLVAAGALLAACWHSLGSEPVAAASEVKAATAAERWAGRKPPPPPPAVRVVEAARPVPGLVAAKAALSKRGVLYLWGAKGPNRFDCSGLTQWAWRQAGVRLGEDTYAQVTQGEPVDYGQPVRPGDLIFPTGSFNRRGPGHVLLAVSSTQAVEAPARGMPVRVVPLPPSYVARRPG